jgi:Cu(I)/Ag(I) efflux system membrane fusion protein
MKPLHRTPRRWLASVIFVAALALAAFVFRKPLIAWFGGKSMGGSMAGGATGAAPAMSASTDAKPALQPIEYPPAAFDALRTAVEAVERVRAELAQDKTQGIAENAGSIAEALKAAAQALPKERGDVNIALLDAASGASALSKQGSLEELRQSFASFNRDFLPLVGIDPRLSQGFKVFECPMFEHARWMQRGTTAANPYMGTKMPTCGNASSWQPKAEPAASASAGSGEIDHYTCSMHPSVKQHDPGKCPICGMDLVPVTKEQQEQGVVMIDEARRQLIGVKIGEVIEAPMRRGFRAVGHVAYDESTLTDVNLKVSGWITHLVVNKTGQRVNAGQTLFSLYSPELYNAEQDFLLATRSAASSSPSPGGGGTGARPESFGRAARQRLHLLGLSEGHIKALEKRGTPSESIAIPSPASGFVIEKDVVAGGSVEAGMKLYRIAALNKVWVEAEVYEADLPHVKVGQHASVTLDYLPEHAYDAKVSYIYPYLDPMSRTGHVRVELANKQLELLPGMYASVNLESAADRRVQVPAAAVVYTGPRRLVFVDLGNGRFRPQEVKLGMEANGMYEVLSGIAVGDKVATSGVFLIAAEARISTAAKYWDKAPDETEPSTAPSAPMLVPSAGAPPMQPTQGSLMPMQKPTASARMPGSKAAAGAPGAAPSAAVFSCPMHPEVRSAVPGKCPKCGMDLERMPSGAGK